MSTYLIINILIIIVPLLLSFESKISFYKKIPSVLKSILIVSSAFILWDVIATERGDWSFNPEHLTGISFFGLPIEEILFFITVPYACIFIFETVNFYIKDQSIKINSYLIWVLILLSLIIALLSEEKNYTFTVMLFIAVSILLINYFNTAMKYSSNYWLTILISFFPFLVVNYFLTSIPVVTYNDAAFSTFRFITIPIEDFFYSFSMISMWILFYNYFERTNE